MTKNNSHPSSGNQVWKFFTSVKLTVVVLLLLASTSIVGTLIPQNSSDIFYIQKYGEVFFNLFKTLDLTDMYASWWFILLLLLLSINIVVCSIDKLSKTWKIIFPEKVNFNLERFQRAKHKESFSAKDNISQLEKKYQVFIEKKIGAATRQDTDAGVAIFAESGRWTRLGVYVVHLSILFMLAGAVIGSVWGYKAFVAIPEGETVDRATLKGSDEPVNLNFEVRCNSFSVTFYDTGQPREFKSNLTVIEGGKETLTKDIIVNDPLRHKGVNLYQSSYGTDSAKNVVLNITSRESGMAYSKKMDFGQTIDMPESGGKFTLHKFVRGYNFKGHNLGEGFVGTVAYTDTTDHAGGEAEEGKEHLHKEEVFVPVKFPTFDKMRKGRFVFEAEDYEKKYYTGLQVTKDPGVWYVYIGFILMIIGCWVTFFMSHQSVCVEIIKGDGEGCQVRISGTANRNRQGMKLKLSKLAAKLAVI